MWRGPVLRRASIRPPMATLVVANDLGDVTQRSKNFGDGGGIHAGTTVDANENGPLDQPVS
jgi:hypothetical protein